LRRTAVAAAQEVCIRILHADLLSSFTKNLTSRRTVC
jgi:hypothetical protein